MAEDNNEVDFDSPEFEAALDAARNRGKEETTTETDTATTEGTTTKTTEGTTTEGTTTEGTTTTTADPNKPNYGEYFKTASEGLINSEDEFKTALTKVKNYDSLETKLKDTEAKIPQFKNPETEALFNLWASGDKKAVLDYIRETEKDYKTMSDLDVRREALAKDHPDWTKGEVELEIRVTYGEQLERIDLSTIDKETEPDEYKEAVAHNKEVDRNHLLLQRDARDDRHKLLEAQSKIELPEIKKAEQAAAPQGKTDAEIAEATAKWQKNVEENLPKLSNIKMNIDDKEVEYVRSDDEKKELTEYMKTFNIFNFAKENGWYNADGTPNSLKIAEDVHYLKNKENITKSLAGQIKTDTTKDVLKRIKNIDGTYTQTDSKQVFDTLEDAAWDAIDKAKAKRRASQSQD
jgi:hypothetical protein